VAAQLPDVLAGLVARLEQREFSIAAEYASASFGDRAIILANSPLAIRLVAERGLWFIELVCGESDDWFDPDVWRSCLEDAPICDEPSPLAAQAEFIVGNLDRLAAAAEGAQSELLSCLRDKRAARSRRRLGLDE